MMKMRRGVNLETLMKTQMSSVMMILSIFSHLKNNHRKKSGFLFYIFYGKNTLKYASHITFTYFQRKGLESW